MAHLEKSKSSIVVCCASPAEDYELGGPPADILLPLIFRTWYVCPIMELVALRINHDIMLPIFQYVMRAVMGWIISS